MKIKISELIEILEISNKIFELTDNKKFSNKTKKLVEVLSLYSEDDLTLLLREAKEQQTKLNTSKLKVKFDYNLLYEIIIMLRSSIDIKLNEKEYLNVYLSQHDGLLSLIKDKDFEWFYEFEERNGKVCTIDDLKLIYRVISGHEIKKQKKSELFVEIKNSIYQTKYYEDINNKFDKSNSKK